jgi:hypothetical protein
MLAKKTAENSQGGDNAGQSPFAVNLLEEGRLGAQNIVQKVEGKLH